MEKRIIEINEEEIKEKINSSWHDGIDCITSFGFWVEHQGLRTKDHLLFEGENIKIKKIVFEFEGEKI